MRRRKEARERDRRLRRILTLGLALATAGTLSTGCATDSGPPPWSRGEAGLVWPIAPERPRIRYLGAIRTAADVGSQPGLLNRVIGLVLGREEVALIKPVSVAHDGAGLLVVADPSVPTVHFFDLARRRHAQLGSDEAAVLSSPVGVATADDGRTYVADSVRGRVFVFDGQRRLVAEIGEGRLERPTGVALAPGQQSLWVVDTLACQLVHFDRAGRELERIGSRGTGPGQFNFPTYIAVGPAGTLTVADSLNFRVQTLQPDGTPLAVFGRAGDGGGDFARPKGLGIDRAGRVYVVDAGFENVQIFDPDGRLLLAFGGPGTGPGEFYLPTGMFLDASDRIWVADSFNSRVQVFQLLPERE